MKKIYTVFLISICIITICYIPVYAESYGRIVSFDHNKIMVYEQLDALRIKSSKGHVLAALGGITNIETTTTTTEISNDIDICLILDRSGSMREVIGRGSGTRTKLQVLKDAVKELIYNIKDACKDDVVARVGVIEYESNVNCLFPLEECTDENIREMKNKIDRMSYGNSTNTYDAIKYANDHIWEDNNNNTLKYTVLITDGIAGSNWKHIPEIISTVKEKTDKFITVFVTNEANITVDSDGTHLYTSGRDAALDYITSDELMFVDPTKLYDTILKDVFNSINESYVDADSLVTDISYAYNVKLGDANNYFSEIDDELINGATLEMEYSFNIVSTEEIKDIYIIDYLDRIGFDLDGAMITNPDVTNADYNWVRDGTDIVTTSFMPMMQTGTNGTYNTIQIKLLLSKVIAIGSDISAQDNHADITIITKDDAYLTANAVETGATGSLGQIIRVEDQILPPSLTITPTLGARNNTNIYIVLIIVLTIVALIVIVLKKITFKKLRNL